jgi:hypothetical protein
MVGNAGDILYVSRNGEYFKRTIYYTNEPDIFKLTNTVMGEDETVIFLGLMELREIIKRYEENLLEG